MAGPFAPLVCAPHNQPPPIGTTITASRHSQTSAASIRGVGSRVRIQDQGFRVTHLGSIFASVHNFQNQGSGVRIKDPEVAGIKAAFSRIQEFFVAAQTLFCPVQDFSLCTSILSARSFGSLLLVYWITWITLTSIKISEGDSSNIRLHFTGIAFTSAKVKESIFRSSAARANIDRWPLP